MKETELLEQLDKLHSWRMLLLLLPLEKEIRDLHRDQHTGPQEKLLPISQPTRLEDIKKKYGKNYTTLSHEFIFQ